MKIFLSFFVLFFTWEEVDSLLNSFATFFEKSDKQKVGLQVLQQEFYDAPESLKR